MVQLLVFYNWLSKYVHCSGKKKTASLFQAVGLEVHLDVVLLYHPGVFLNWNPLWRQRAQNLRPLPNVIITNLRL